MDFFRVSFCFFSIPGWIFYFNFFSFIQACESLAIKAAGRRAFNFNDGGGGSCKPTPKRPGAVYVVGTAHENLAEFRKAWKELKAWTGKNNLRETKQTKKDLGTSKWDKGTDAYGNGTSAFDNGTSAHALGTSAHALRTSAHALGTSAWAKGTDAFSTGEAKR